MKNKFTSITLFMLISILICSNVYAMSDLERARPRPSTEVKNENRNDDYRWTWLSDTICARFHGIERLRKNDLLDFINEGRISSAWGIKEDGEWKTKTRDTYTGKWCQDTAGIWSFTFDDCTIPVGVTKIDGVLYAFNAFGELKDGYNYWGDLKTASDGLVVSEDAEFLKYLETEYLPECTSHE